MRKSIRYPFLFTVILLLMACANMGTPDGGPYDETPPVVVSTHPRIGATHAKSQKITLRFNENIKLDNANEKVVVSPPQINQPEILSSGKQITIELLDTLKPDMTYTIDFADAIEDNNEGNPLGDFAFTFSTGEQLDTFQLSGYVVNAENLEPIKGILVGLYAADSLTTEIPDSIFHTQPMQRISRTDSHGHFIVKGLNPKCHYRVFALQDMDQDFRFSQKSEQIAFNHELYKLHCAPDVRFDTIWHDSIYYDSIVPVPYTHYYPDDIVLRAFTETGQDRAFIKSERPELEKFTLFFTAPDTQQPQLRGLNFNSQNAFTIERTDRNDTLDYWIRDSLIYNHDTLEVELTYRATDTLGQLVPQTDTLLLISRQTYAHRQKQKAEAWEKYAKDYRDHYRQEMKEKEYAARNAEDKEEEKDDDTTTPTTPTDEAAPPTTETNNDTHSQNSPTKNKKEKRKKKKSSKIKDEDITVPPMPETLLEVNFQGSTIDPDQNVTIKFDTPIDTAYLDHVHFQEVVNDSERVDRPFLLQRVEGQIKEYRLYAEWQPNTKYECLIDTGAFVNMYGLRSLSLKKTITIKSLDEYSTLFVTLQQADTSAIVCLVNGSGKIVKRQRASNGKADFYFIKPDTYYLYMYYDHNGDGHWTTGDYAANRQGEEAYFYTGALQLRAGWEITQTWNPNAHPLYQQKPSKITKQKPDKAKDLHLKNQQRDQQNHKNKTNTQNTRNNNTYGGGYINQ